MISDFVRMIKAKEVKSIWKKLDARTLGPDQYDWNFCGIPIVGHFIEVIRDGGITDLVVKAEHEDYRVDPGREL